MPVYTFKLKLYLTSKICQVKHLSWVTKLRCTIELCWATEFLWWATKLCWAAKLCWAGRHSLEYPRLWACEHPGVAATAATLARLVVLNLFSYWISLVRSLSRIYCIYRLIAMWKKRRMWVESMVYLRAKCDYNTICLPFKFGQFYYLVILYF